MVLLALTKEVHNFYNEEGIELAAVRLHPEEQPSTGGHWMLVSIKLVFGNEVSLYKDPIEEDNTLCLGQFALWRKEPVAATSPTAEEIGNSSAVVEPSVETPALSDGGFVWTAFIE